MADPGWYFTGTRNHFMIPPRYGRGNHNDHWAPICGDRNNTLAPWKSIQFNQAAPYCKDCRQILGPADPAQAGGE